MITGAALASASAVFKFEPSPMKTGTITASDLKFDFQAAGDGVNTLSVYAVSLVEYES